MATPKAFARLSHADLLELRRWNTPTIYNGWEQITRRDSTRECFNLEPAHDFMPQMGPMAGRAVTVVIQPGNRAHAKANPDAWVEYRSHVASIPGPKIVVVQDLDKPALFGAYWGEVNSSIHRALGCIGSVTDGAIRDVDEMCYAGFKALARGLCVGHAASLPVRWNCPVEVFGCSVQPGQLIHADKHGFLVVPPEDEPRLLEAARFMDSNECKTMIPVARDSAGKSPAEILDNFNRASDEFRRAAQGQFGKNGEW